MSVKSIKVKTLLIIWAASFAGASISALLIAFSYLVQRKEDQATDAQQLTPPKKVAK